MSTIRYPGTTNEPNADFYGRENAADYGPDRDPGNYASSAREYAAAGELGQGDRMRDYGQQRYRGGQPPRDGGGEPYRGSYAHDGHRFEDVGRYRNYEDDNRPGNPNDRPMGNRPAGPRPGRDDRDDRGFFARAGDEVRSWFGDDEAERRREMDSRYDAGRQGDRHDDYRNWRSGQMAELDRDYDEYHRENQTKFHNEFTAWRTERQGQRQSLNQVEEHMEVVGSDGAHVGTVDKVRGDRILLTKNDKDAGGHHHTIPSRWIDQVDGKVTLRKTAAEAQKEWRDVERGEAESQFGDRTANREDGPRDSQGRMLNRSFSGTY